jgi:hypothetical protein
VLFADPCKYSSPRNAGCWRELAETEQRGGRSAGDAAFQERALLRSDVNVEQVLAWSGSPQDMPPSTTALSHIPELRHTPNLRSDLVTSVAVEQLRSERVAVTCAFAGVECKAVVNAWDGDATQGRRTCIYGLSQLRSPIYRRCLSS